jgi:hypothetical protein
MAPAVTKQAWLRVRQITANLGYKAPSFCIRHRITTARQAIVLLSLGALNAFVALMPADALAPCTYGLGAEQQCCPPSPSPFVSSVSNSGFMGPLPIMSYAGVNECCFPNCNEAPSATSDRPWLIVNGWMPALLYNNVWDYYIMITIQPNYGAGRSGTITIPGVLGTSQLVFQQAAGPPGCNLADFGCG